MFATKRLRARVLLAVGALTLVAAVDAQAQARWVADKKASLAWWQINPHMNHLWATTCPQEPSWRPGEGRSGGWVVNKWMRPPKQGEADISDTTIIPLYPRRRVRSVCTEAVEASVTAVDATKGLGVKGVVTVQVNNLITGLDIRDEFMKDKMLQVNNFPEVSFTIDSLSGVHNSRDTVVGLVRGVLTLRGVNTPIHATLKYWPEVGGLRVLAKLKIAAQDLSSVYGISGMALGLGVASAIWQDIYMGVDLLMKPSEASASH
jgi:polyisoprenoid-binding protein YceI